MKKIIALLLIIGCLSTMFCLSVGAASSNEVDFVVNAEGEGITVDINTNFACGSLQGALQYDNDNVSYKEINFENSIISKNKEINSIKNVDGATKFAFIGDVKDGTAGKWATVSYEGAKPKFDISSFKAYAANGTKIDADVYVVFRGDANIDGRLDLKDLVRFKKIAVGISDIEDIYKKNIDVDSSGTTDYAIDMVAMQEYVLSILFK